MENPATWGKLEHTIDNALTKSYKAFQEGRIGLSSVRQIADALRKEGLVIDEICLDLHKKIETRINKLEQPILGKKGGVDRQQVLKIIEEEFGKLTVVSI